MIIFIHIMIGLITIAAYFSIAYLFGRYTYLFDGGYSKKNKDDVFECTSNGLSWPIIPIGLVILFTIIWVIGTGVCILLGFKGMA